MNITNTIWRNCSAHPDRTAVIYEGHPVSYSALRSRVELASARLANTGVKSGDVIALSIGNKLSYLIVLLSVVRLGAVAAPLLRGLSEEYRAELITSNRTHSMIVDKEGSWLNKILPASHQVKASALLAPPANGEHFKAPPVAQDLDEQPWLIALSSGTTGKPKRSPQTHGRNALLVSLSPLDSQDGGERVFVFASLGIEYGITNVLRQLFRSATTVLTDSTKPADFYAAVERDRPTRVVTTTGNASQLVAHAAKALPESLTACASIKCIVVTGSFVSLAIEKGIKERICARLEVEYGSTETGSLAMSTQETRAARPKSAGRLMPWVQAESVDENDQPLPPGHNGVLRFKSPLLTTGYLGDEQATASAFRDGWFYPGDIGSVGVAGYLFLKGRTDHVLNLGGNKVDSRLIEELLDGQPEIIESAVVAVDTGMGLPVLVAAVEARAPVDGEHLKRLCLERLGKTYMPHAIVEIDTLPRNESGKVMRQAVAARVKVSNTEQQEPQER